ncbi:MAG: stage III sporulation protein AE [bacterium]
MDYFALAAVPESLYEALPAGMGELGAPLEILEEAVFRGEEPLRAALGLAAAVLAAALLGAVGESFEGAGGTVRLAALLGIAGIGSAGLGSLLGSASQALEEIFIFSNALLPVMASALAASGLAGAAGTQTGLFLLFSDLLAALEREVLMPLVYAYLALSVGAAAFGGGLGALKKAVKWGVNLLLGALAGGYMLFLKTSWAVAASADAAAVKVAKAALQNLVPVVGKIVSGAAESVAAGALVLKNALGAFGLTALLALAVGPILRAAVSYLALKLVSALAEPLAGGELAGVIADLATAMAWAVAACFLAALALFLAVVTALEGMT